MHEGDMECAGLHITTGDWKEELRASLEGDVIAQELKAQLAVTGQLPSEYSFKDDILLWKGKYYVGASTNLINKIVQVLHDGTEGGHSGVLTTYKRVDNQFIWPKMKQDIATWVQECDICQKNKSEHVPLLGLLQPIPTAAW